MHTARTLAFASTALALAMLAPMPAQAQATFAHARDAGTLSFGYLPGARPLTWRNDSGAAEGYAISLCRLVAEAVRLQLKQPGLKVEFVPLDEDPAAALAAGRIDMSCTPMQATLTRRASVDFSIPVMPGGTGILVRKNVSPALRNLLEGRKPGAQPIWRGSPQLAALQQRDFAVVPGTASAKLLEARRQEIGVNFKITPVTSMAEGLARVVSGKSDALVSDRNVLMDLARNGQGAGDVMVIDREFDPTSYAFALRRGDEDFRLLVDRVLSRTYRTGKFEQLYATHFGPAGESTRMFFRRLAEPD
ncbi:amino acid ABC transporter substrate-binding protein [Lysobacter helvus]|uniref:Amino acid ABC transporter substrate-binding protein n=2 Tax=Lysobacteraceae TaxID=32033 RepID=A0ABN6G204_9GAMM|nr:MULTISPECIES: amino acid ABC transporter substrate-binding protein [Lysobacter]BCT93932.1 amino acid ABC transporter substrate-binding protein [Lysobacter caseinilyticus]BCT97088.1 amino acid ABC transporter substrate-binding protein [Lysobacter helvus]